VVLQYLKNVLKIQLLTLLIWLQLFSILGSRLFLVLTIFFEIWSAGLVLTLITV